MDFGNILGYAANPLGGLADLLGGEGSFRQIDPIGGKLFGFKSKEEMEVERQFKEMQRKLEEARPQYAQGRMQGLSQQLGLFNQGMNPMLDKMYGPSAMYDTSGLMNNPLMGPGGPLAPKPPPPPPSPESQRKNTLQQATLDNLIPRDPTIQKEIRDRKNTLSQAVLDSLVPRR